MVHQRLPGRGLDKRLLLGRIAGDLEVTSTCLDTRQPTFGCFQRLGFVIETIAPNGYWDGLDRYDMRLVLNESAQSGIPDAEQGVQP